MRMVAQCECYQWIVVMPGNRLGTCGYCDQRPIVLREANGDDVSKPLKVA